MKLNEKYKTLLDKYGVNTPIRIAHFMAQIEHESGLAPKRESLYFTSIDGLRKTFYSPFKNKTDSFVKSFLRNSEHCANYVYANRGGNGDQSSGDGFKYRGGGLNTHADKDDLDAVSDKINIGRLTEKEGDSNGYAHRKACLNKWKTILNYKNIAR